MIPTVLRKAIRRTIDVATATLLAIFAAGALLPTLDARAMIVTSGSMSPTVDAGDVVIVRAAEPTAVHEGDVITFAGHGADHLTTHRVLQVRHVDGDRYFQTQGDANATPDADLAPAASLQGVVVAHVPNAGRVLGWLTSRSAVVATVVIPALWLAIAEIRSLLAPAKPRELRRHPPRRPCRATTVVVAFAAVLTVASLNASDSTHATLSDRHAVGANEISTAGQW